MDFLVLVIQLSMCITDTYFARCLPSYLVTIVWLVVMNTVRQLDWVLFLMERIENHPSQVVFNHTSFFPLRVEEYPSYHNSQGAHREVLPSKKRSGGGHQPV